MRQGRLRLVGTPFDSVLLEQAVWIELVEQLAGLLVQETELFVVNLM